MPVNRFLMSGIGFLLRRRRTQRRRDNCAHGGATKADGTEGGAKVRDGDGLHGPVIRDLVHTVVL